MKKLMLLFVMSFMVFAMAFGAVVQVAAGTDVISTAYAAATSGDIIELTTGGGDGTYIETASLDVADKSITIRAAASLSAKPLIQCTEDGEPVFYMTGSDDRLEIVGLEIDGRSRASKYLVRFDTGDTLGTAELIIKDCEAYSFSDKIVKIYGNTGVDSVVVDNSIFHDGASEGICLYSGSSSDPAAIVRYAEITNTTIYDIEREAIKAQTYTDYHVLVDRCTFYDIGANDKKAMIYLNDSDDFTVKNSIFAKNENPDAEKFADFETSAGQFHNNVVWNTTNYEVDKATVTDTLHVDPLFADPANADFTIGEELLFTFADDGGAIGDPRWAPQPTVHEVAAGVDAISDAMDAAEAGDIIELTTSGLDGTYIEGSKLSMTKDITIRAGAVSARPIIQQTGGSTNPMVEIKADVHVTLDGLEFQGNNNAKYFIIVDTDDTTTTVELVVTGCEAWDFSDKGIKFYGNAGVDYFEFSNSILHETASEAICLYEGSTSNPAAVIREAVIKNSTIYDSERECIKAETYAYGSLLVDQITAYNCGDTDGKSMIYVDDWTDVEVKNSIFVGNHYSSYFGRFENSDNQFHHNVIWDGATWDIDNATISDTLRVDPGFADAANGDFTIPDPSVLRTFGDLGGAVGDPRWAPEAGGQKTLNVFTDGMGTVTLDPAGGLYDEGTSVTMTATADSLWLFDHWSENVSVFPPNNPTATITVNSNMNVTAYFIPTLDEYTVTTAAVGLGHVEEVHTAFFPVEGYWHGDSLKLTAVADTSTWVFEKWVDANGTESTVNPLEFAISGDVDLTAYFVSTLDQYTLDLAVVGSGDVSVSPKPVTGFETYDAGTVVSLSATQNMGWEFAGYSGGMASMMPDVDITMNANYNITATFTEQAVPGGDLMVDASWDLRDAIEFATYNTNVERIVLTEVGPYAPDEADRSDGKLPNLNIEAPITIVPCDTLSEKPIIKAWGEGGSEALFRMRTNGSLTISDLIIDGYSDASGSATKYMFRLDDGAPITNSIKADGVEFFGTKEAFMKYYSQVHVDSLILRNCLIHDIGKEGIYDNAAGTTDYLEISNSTFYGVKREIVRYKVNTPLTVIDHVTVDSCGYGDGSKYSSFKFEVANEGSITNSIISDILNTTYGYSFRMYGPDFLIDNCIVYNSAEIDNNDGAIVGDNVIDIDPMYMDVSANDYTLKDSSLAYSMADDGTAAIGDLRWATAASPVAYNALDITAENGKVDASPAGMGKYYASGTVVTLTADADTLYKFGEWGGDLSGTTNPETLTMDADKAVTASFDEAFYTVDLNVNMSVWADNGNFNVAADSVDIAGNMNDWGGVPMWTEDADGDTVYTYSLVVDENYPDLEWKFRINGSWNDATAEFPYGGPARTVTVAGDTSMTFWYNDEEPAIPGVMDIPAEFVLNQNYPNPFNPTTTIGFGLPIAEYTTVKLYDVSGRQVMSLIDGDMPAGYHDVILNASHLPSGLYFYSIKAGDFTAVKKLTLLK